MNVEQSLISQKFRALSDTFQRLAAEDRSEAYRHSTSKLDEAGRLVIRAFRQGWLPSIDGLAKLVEWIDNPPTLTPPATAMMNPCPSNLWLEFCGNNRLSGQQAANGRLKIVRGFHGGLLPTQYPEALKGWSYGDRPSEWRCEHEHYATVCRWLAEQITCTAEPEWSQPITTEEIGKKFDVSGRTVQRWFKGETPSPGIEIRKVGRLYQWRYKPPAVR